jgi:hypothetical protein
MNCGTWFKRRVHYIEVSVVEAATQRTVWRVQFHHGAGVQIPDYASRSQKFIRWFPDSSAVTIPLGSEKQVTLPVP